jgi:hypothetical protein
MKMASTRELIKRSSKKVTARGGKNREVHNINAMTVGATNTSSQVVVWVDQNPDNDQVIVVRESFKRKRTEYAGRGEHVSAKGELGHSNGGLLKLPSVWYNLKRYGPQSSLCFSDPDFIEDYKTKNELQSGLVIELEEKDSKIESIEKKATDNLHSITQLKEAQHNFNAERKKLKDALNDATLLGEEEPEDIAGMERKGLVDKIAELEKNLVGASSHGFHNGFEQIKVVNPGVEIST